METTEVENKTAVSTEESQAENITAQETPVACEIFSKPMITAKTPKDELALLKKILNLHKEMRKLDWTPDGFNKSWNHEYFTAGLIKSHFQKACTEVGLIFIMNIDKVENLAPSRGFNARMSMHAYLDVIDVDTGAIISYPALGEAGDSGDKCSAKLMTMTIKSVIATNFAVADIDPERDLADNFGSREAKQNTARDTLRAIGSHTPPKPSAPSKPTSENKKPVAKEVQEAMDKKVEESKLEVDSAEDTRDMTTVQKNTISMIFKSLSEKPPEGLDVDDFKKSYDDVLKNGNRGTAGEWIKKYRVMMK